ncbi:MAG: L-seryl-tRNA(Sec) selenium transferase [Synergistaceae bacterium]|jgi:L-seryl-tRNA(Ser) seleniumtransferase|nr:L-seryl-tRNA(Sec) selenium transferase [Synergistaceae bacterium]
MNDDKIDGIEHKMRLIPGMDVLLEKEWTRPWQNELGRSTVKRVFNEELARVRQHFLSRESEEREEKSADFSPNALRETLEALLRSKARRCLRPVVNATGVVVHTNLGRSCLAREALQAAQEVARGYSNLEYDLEEGTRGDRNAHVEKILCELSDAEAALVVNNNAGAVLLCLSALAQGSEVVVSRGELVEIGGAFRIPDIMRTAGARLVETGTTNRTHLRDYAEAITERTSLLLKVHPSNFRIEGFTTAPERKALAALAHERGLILMEDAGSGLLMEGQALGPAFEGETDVKTCLREGVDLVTFSGDKMLGGPQAGVVVGKKDILDRLRGHPLLRALRVDKMTLAAFEATMRLYMKGDYDAIPTLAMLRRTSESMQAQAARLAGELRRVAGPQTQISIATVNDAVVGGACPALPLSGCSVAVT